MDKTECIRDMGSHWWEYAAGPNTYFADAWDLHFVQIDGAVARIIRYGEKYAYFAHYHAEILNGKGRVKWTGGAEWKEVPVDEIPLDYLMERVESEYEEYLKSVRDYFAKLVDDFGPQW